MTLKQQLENGRLISREPFDYNFLLVNINSLSHQHGPTQTRLILTNKTVINRCECVGYFFHFRLIHSGCTNLKLPTLSVLYRLDPGFNRWAGVDGCSIQRRATRGEGCSGGPSWWCTFFKEPYHKILLILFNPQKVFTSSFSFYLFEIFSMHVCRGEEEGDNPPPRQLSLNNELVKYLLNTWNISLIRNNYMSSMTTSHFRLTL